MGSGWLIEEWVSEEDEGKGMMLVAQGAMSIILIRRSLGFAVVELALASDTVQVGRHLRELRANLGGKLGRGRGRDRWVQLFVESTKATRDASIR